MKLSVIVPVFNEESTIYKVLNAVRQVQLIHNIEKEIIHCKIFKEFEKNKNLFCVCKSEWDKTSLYDRM